MKIVMDSNRVLAAMIKESTTREILFDKTFEFIAPEYIVSEIRKYKDRVINAANITEDEFEIALALIFEHITIVPENEYLDRIEKLKSKIKDLKDIPYIAACIATNSEGIWTHDPHFENQKEAKVFTNIYMLKLSKRIKSL